MVAFLLDEHYPGRAAAELRDRHVDALALVADVPRLRGLADTEVLRFAASERRVVLTEDVSTFTVAMAAVPDHVGVVFCHYARFPRSPTGLRRLVRAVVTLDANPPTELSVHPVVWWLADET